MKLSLKKAIISAVVVLAGVSLFMPAASVFAAPASSSSTVEETEVAECQAGAFTWLVCPAITVGQEVVGLLEGWIVDQLDTGPLQTTGRYEDLHEAWAKFRDLANVFFIGVFFVIIFAQALNIKMDSYSIKMMLPRLIVAAIAIQFSFFIMQIGVDISNILGAGIAGIFNSFIPAGSATSDIGTVGLSFGALTLVGVGGALAAGAVITGLAVPVLLLLLAGAIALVGVILTVWLRVLLLQFLILLAPLAIVAWVMPNTEKWFAVWRTNVIKLLLMYPIIVFMISAGALATHITSITAEEGGLASVLAACVPILIFFMIPGAIKASGSIMAATAGFVMGHSTGYSRAIRSSQLMKDSRQDIKERSLRQYADNDPKTVKGFGNKTRAQLRRGSGRLMSGNAFAFQHIGDAGRRKMATGVAAARHALESDYNTFFQDNAFSNPTLLDIAQAGLVDHKKTFTAKDTYGTEHSFKMNHHLAEAAVSRMIQQQGMVELSTLLDGEKGNYDANGNFIPEKKSGIPGTERDSARGLFDHNTNQWKSKEIQQTMLRAMGPNAGTVLQKITHAVHLQADKAYGELSGTNIAALGAGSGITAATEAVKWNRINSLNAMVQVINSNSLAGSIQNDVAKSFKRELMKADREGKFAGITIQAQGQTYTSVSDFLNRFISEAGQVEAVQGDIKRDGYDPIIQDIKREQATLDAAIKQAREDFKARGGTADFSH